MIDWYKRILEAALRGSYKSPIQAAVYDASPQHEEVIRAKGRQVLAEFVRPGMSVLDLGCGFGAVRSLLPWDVRYVGVDLFSVFIEEARRVFADFPTDKASFVEGDAVHVLLGMQPNSFDLAVSREITCDDPSLMDAALRVAPVYIVFSTGSERPVAVHRRK